MCTCRRENKIRVFYFQSDVPRDIGLMETREYHCLIDRCHAEAKGKSMACYAHVFDWFKEDVLIQCTSPIISRESLERFLLRPPGYVLLIMIGPDKKTLAMAA